MQLTQLLRRQDELVHLAMPRLAREGHFANVHSVFLLLLFGLEEQGGGSGAAGLRLIKAPQAPHYQVPGG